jgi:hypothetical protein
MVLAHEHTDGFLGAGLRAELRLAERDEGILDTASGAFYLAGRGDEGILDTASGAFYLAGRARVVDSDLGGELVLGDYVDLHDTVRVGFEAGVTWNHVRKQEGDMTAVQTQPTVVLTLNVGFGL